MTIFLDVDECAELKNACGKGNCSNSVGLFSCKCEAGFKPGEDSPACVGKLMKVVLGRGYSFSIFRRVQGDERALESDSPLINVSFIVLWGVVLMRSTVKAVGYS